jgi:opacity protein-like surface antigen
MPRDEAEMSLSSRIEKVLRKFSLLAILLLSPVLFHGQVGPAARGGNARLLAGGQYSYFHTDFPSTVDMHGIGAYANFFFTPRFGAEGELRFIYFGDFHGENQKNYLIGPKVYIRPFGRIKPYAKFLIGLGSIRYPFNIGSGTYFAYAPGGGIDYRVFHDWYFRADYEFQFWPSAPGIPGEPNNGLTPRGVSGGLAYRFF